MDTFTAMRGNLKNFLYVSAAILFVLLCAPLHAQSGGVDPTSGGGGCVDSPENPTAVLALAGSLGAGAAALRTRYRNRRRNKGN